jgi:AhpD family alkylhydroperoxidase
MADAPRIVPRIPPLPREEWTDEARAVFGYFEGRTGRENGSRSNLIMTLANHPRFATAYLAFGRMLLEQSSLSDWTRELLTLRVGWLGRCEYEWVNHETPARNAGMTDAQIEAIKAGPEAWTWPGPDRAVLEAIDQLVAGGRIDDATWAALSASYDTHQLMELVFTIGHYQTLAWAADVFGIEVEAAHADNLRQYLENRDAQRAAG